MSSDNFSDLDKLIGGTARFTFQDIAYQGIISKINYVPIPPGAINVELFSLQPVADGPAVPDIPLNFTVSFFFSEVINRPKELIVDSLVPFDEFGKFFIYC